MSKSARSTKAYQCPECDWRGQTPGALTAHINKNHSNSPLAGLEHKYGEFAPRPGGAHRPDRPLRAAPSGIPSIDYAIGIGGVPRGTIIEVFGKPATGKTFTALSFSRFAQEQGGMVGFVDAEHALQPTFAQLTGVDLDRMFYTAPPNGETALEITRDYISTGLYDIWTVDSVHALTPKSIIEGTFDEQQPHLAKLMSQAMQGIDHVIAATNTLCVFINHVKDKPMVQYGRTWYKPGGNALDYYSSVQLHVQVAQRYENREGRQIGHKVRVKVDKSKVAAPHAEAEFDLFYMDGQLKPEKGKPPREVVPGVDIATCWFDVLKKSETIKATGGQYYLVENSERLGYQDDVMQELRQTDSPLLRSANKQVYGDYVDADVRKRMGLVA